MNLAQATRRCGYSWLLVLSLVLVPASVTRAEGETPRLVSVAGSLTEILYALDLQELLVGVDTSSQWPGPATELPQVGYQRALSAEGILSLAPDKVLATADAGPVEVLQQLQDAGVDIEQFPRDYTLDGLYERIRRIGDTYDRQPEARRLIDSIQSDINVAASRVKGKTAPRVVFLLGIDAGSAMAAGSETSASAMIALSGAENALADYHGYKPVNAEALIKAAPDYLLVVQHDSAREPASIVQAVQELPGVKLTPAGEQSRIIILDALRFLGFGPRTGAALKELTDQLFPDDIPR